MSDSEPEAARLRFATCPTALIAENAAFRWLYTFSRTNLHDSVNTPNEELLNIDTTHGLAQTIARVRRRDPTSLATFIVSLAREAGPVGEQVRTFIVGDDLAETVTSLRARLSALETPSEYQHRHAHGKEIGQSLGFILDSIENLVLPVDPNAAFELLASVFERDAQAMENCLEHHDSVQSAFEQAAVLIGKAAVSLPRQAAEEKLRELAANDAYGVRRPLTTILASRGEGP